MINKIFLPRTVTYVLSFISIAFICLGTTEKLVLANAPIDNTEASTQKNPSTVDRIDKLVIKLSERRVYLYQDDRVIGHYPIAVGKEKWETPTGNFEVLQMVRNPAWQNPFDGTVIPAGDGNPLGDRWIGFWTDGKNYIGFHGTPNEETVGRAASHGCIRMLNEDVRNLFERVTVGTPVIVEK
jgi:L,D-transpeptidase ErfK/SrfK